MRFLRRLATRSIPALVRTACVLGIAAVAMMLASVVCPRPLVVISAMSIGHALGIGAFGFYLLAVVLDAARTSKSGIDEIDV